MTHLVVAAMLLAAPPTVSPDPKSLEIPPAELQKARALIRQFGSPAFTDREAAARQLRSMGRLALPALQRAAESDPDPEVRFRCELLLPAAAADDFNARLATFLADTDGKYEHDFPGWARFRDLTGNDPLARGLFAELLRSEPNRSLIAALTQDSAELVRRVIARRVELYEQMYPRAPGVRYDPTLVDAAGLLFGEILIGDKGSPRGFIRAATPYTLLTRTTVMDSLNTDRYGPVVRKLVLGWLDSRESPTGLSQAVTLANRLGWPDAVKYAAKMIRAEGATAYQRASAATTIARIGRKEDAVHLRSLLTDESVVRPGINGNLDIQVRDVALAMAAQLTGHDPVNELGLQPQSASETARYYYWNYSFRSSEDRDKALALWSQLEPKLAPTSPLPKK